jgi:hypothetical protein
MPGMRSELRQRSVTICLHYLLTHPTPDVAISRSGRRRRHAHSKVNIWTGGAICTYKDSFCLKPNVLSETMS